MNTQQARRYLKNFELKKLFREELGWDNYSTPIAVQVNGVEYTLQPIAQKRGVVALRCVTEEDIPPYATRRKIERQVAKSYREHFVVYTDSGETLQVWQWVRQESGKPLASREHRYYRGQTGESLLHRLERIEVRLEDEEKIGLLDVTSRVQAAFDVESTTKRFYDLFKRERDAFEKFLQGIPDEGMKRWYVSVMLNRLMFIYFIQRKGFLNGDTDYLRHKLVQSQAVGEDRYYREFLCPLFFEGFAKPAQERSPEMSRLLGSIPYLNGGIFQQHQVEQMYGHAIQVPDAAFVGLYKFFDGYQWYLDDRPLSAGNEINPDVLGYIFEKYINQKEMGAYYTKEDITDYISKYTIIPFLFDRAREGCRVAFEGDMSVWSLLQADPDRYIYPAMRKGTDLSLPVEIAAGVGDVSQRARWNTPAADAYALPTEIWRETVARRQRYEEVWLKLANGEVREINDLITYNLDIQQFAQDVLETCEGPELLRSFWQALLSVTVLDPTCGSGAFLFAALNILEALYEACLERMRAFVVDELPADAPAGRYADFRQVLADIERHPSPKYFVYKSIIVNNLYGVDIMAEAVEIAKLRLFLKLVAQVERVEDVEPLPDVDFNIRAGNTLVGFTSLDDVERAIRGVGTKQERMLLLPEDEALLAEIKTDAASVEQLFSRFHQMQTAHDEGVGAAEVAAVKAGLSEWLDVLDDRLNRLLAQQYGVDPAKPQEYDRWLQSHQPFHWFVGFYGIMSRGGFDVAIGNPPYIRYSDVKDYRILDFRTASSGDLYAFVVEQSYALTREQAMVGFIVPISIFGVDGFQSLQRLTYFRLDQLWAAHFSNRPAQLFAGAQKRLTILLGRRGPAASSTTHTTSYIRWKRSERNDLFASRIAYAVRFDSHRVFPGSLEKLGSKLEIAAFSRLTRIKQSVAQSVKTSSKCVYYTRKFGYFLAFLDFVPIIEEIDTGSRITPSELKTVCFGSDDEVLMAIAVFSSSTFFWFWNTLSDCRNLNRRDLLAFPVDLARLSPSIAVKLRSSATEYISRLLATSKYMTKGGLRIQTFDYASCKDIIDDFDRHLSHLFCFTDEELDFIINYDIKYRMGDELQNEREEE